MVRHTLEMCLTILERNALNGLNKIGTSDFRNSSMYIYLNGVVIYFLNICSIYAQFILYIYISGE